MSFPKLFLTELAEEKQLTEREKEVFLALFGEGKTRLEIAERLHVQESAVSTCLSGVYKKFAISESGPIKESRLKDVLKKREEIWQKQQQATNISPPSTQPQSEDELFQQVRERCRKKILSQHSRMQFLSRDEIEVDQLYVDVWLLNRPPHKFMVSPAKLMETFDLRNDRLGLGDRIQRNPGFEVANAQANLVILGKPGAGKTTFLKHLAVDWSKGKFQPDLIAILIEFRRIQDEQGDFMYATEKELGLKNWSQIQKIKQQIQISDLEKKEKEKEIETLKQQLESVPLQILLQKGKLLLLMDGLDEVPTSELRSKVKNELRKLVEDYPKNRFILTCRTQIIESIPNGFTSVEVADFSSEQTKQFVQNLFTASGKSEAEAEQQWKTFDNVVSNNPALKELTVTPVLLSLMCLVFQDAGEMPSQVNWLYEKGIKLLLEKWNDAKEIDGWEVGTETYRKLSVEQKEALLIEIARQKFEDPNNFVLFQQDEITNYIGKFLQLTNPKEKVAVLKAIEAQHGLLIERADELWSFSHLTFQEHFTIRWLTELPSKQLAKKIADRQWQKVVKQLVKSQQPADKLVRLIKQAIDLSIKSEVVLQEFLSWVLEKSRSIPNLANHKPAAIRAFYFSFYHDRNLDLDLDRDLNLDRALALDRALDRALALALALDPELIKRLEQLRNAVPNLSTNREFQLQQWWQANGTQWREQLRQVMIEHRNIGHDWQFSNAQKQQLQRYYDANKFLVDLINIRGAVSNKCRTEIEDTLLLPWEEL